MAREAWLAAFHRTLLLSLMLSFSEQIKEEQQQQTHYQQQEQQQLKKTAIDNGKFPFLSTLHINNVINSGFLIMRTT